MNAIKSDNLTHKYGKVTALDNASLEVEQGQLFGFIGPNGAGKTTAINIFTGQTKPSSGSCSVLGIDPTRKPVKVREKVGILPEREDPPTFFTPHEYLEFVGKTRGISNVGEKIKTWAKRLKFESELNTLNRDLSKGEKQKIMISQAFIHDPKLVFIDEPLINLDPVVQEKLKQFFLRYSEKGNTLFLSTHVMNLAEEICTHIGIINNGKLVTSDKKEHIMDDNETLTEAFLRLVDE